MDRFRTVLQHERKGVMHYELILKSSKSCKESGIYTEW